MKLLIKLLLVIILAYLLAMLKMFGHGQVIIFAGAYRVDFALATFSIGIALLFVLLYWLVRMIVNINRLPYRIKQYRLSNKLQKSRKLLNSAALYYFAGKYNSSAKDALNSMSQEISRDNQFVALLIALKSYNYMQARNNEEVLISKLGSYQDKKYQMAKYMVLAQIEYARNNYSLCLENLNKVIDLDRKHVQARLLLVKVFLQLNNYEKAYETLKWLVKHNYLPGYKVQGYKLKIYKGLFECAHDQHELYHLYNNLDREDKKDQIINKFYEDAKKNIR